MSILKDYNRLSQFVSALVDRKVKSVSLAITSSVGYLQQFVNQSEAHKNAAATSAATAGTRATAAETSATNSRNSYRDFLATYAGVNTNDPTVSSLGDPIKDKAFSIRKTDGRLRYASVDANGVTTWADATVKADLQSIKDAAQGLLLFLDVNYAQQVKGPVSFDNITSVPSINDFTGTRPPQAKNIADYIKAQLQALIPPRTITAFYGETAPAGWAMCDGGSYALIAGGTIVTPDLRGRVIAGVNADFPLGNVVGALEKTVTSAEGGANISLNYQLFNGYAGGGTQSGIAGGRNGTAPSIDNPGHNHNVTTNVVQPTMGLNYIMKL